MKNKICSIIIGLLLGIIFTHNVFGYEQFNFDITEVEILDEGNIIKGLKKGTVTTDDGIIINSNKFYYNKIKNLLITEGNVEIIDTIKETKIYSDKLTYDKNNEIITTEGNVVFVDIKQNITILSDSAIYKKSKEIISTNKNSKAIYEKNKIITATKFNYSKNENILIASGNVKVEDKIKDHIIETKTLTYFKNEEKITTEGQTVFFIQSKYEIESADVIYLVNQNHLSSDKKTKIINNNSQIYNLDRFDYSINNEIIKGENILIITNYNKPKSDKFYFSNAIINLKDKKFIGKDTQVVIHKNVFDNPENDPRLSGVSATADDKITVVNKGIFTSCKKRDGCPPWTIKSSKITHDKNKKQLMYENALLKIYDIPVLYFPKFFHPDPTVNRQSGLLKPELNNSNILGDSITIPYFKAISKSKDLTFTPTIFTNEFLMSQIEYRAINKNSSMVGDIGYVNNYQSSTDKQKKNLSHLFAKYNHDLNLKNFISSDFSLSLERVSNDSYLKIFSPHITESTLRPNFDKLENNFQLYLNHETYNFNAGFKSFETLNVSPSDRYQFILPYYKLDWFLDQNFIPGTFNFSSDGANDLNNTNKLETSVINDLKYNSLDFFSKNGFKTKFNINLKNLNSIGKSSTKYKSSPQVEIVSLFNTEVSLPLIRNTKDYTNLLTPKFSFRFNPSDMKDYSSSDNKVNVDSIFANNRLGLSDTFEAGRSIALGLDFKQNKKSSLNDINNYFEFKLGAVLRDKKEEFIPRKSSLNEKHSNIFGSINKGISENLKLGYNFSVDNDYTTFEYNDFNATLSLNNIVTTFHFIEENNEVGDTNVLTNTISYEHDDQNFFTFKTRRNRKINLTEYYDLVYEYKNDCLIAGIKYNKTYYSDGDLKPSENLMFTLTLVPLTSYEYKANEMLNY